jgi:hemolysin activation/secretion protein
MQPDVRRLIRITLVTLSTSLVVHLSADADGAAATSAASASPSNPVTPASAAPAGRAPGRSSPQQASAASNRFDIWEFLVLGNRALPVRSVERAVYPFLGPGRDIHTVEQAKAALEKAYADAGYGAVFVDIPPQEVTDGVVRLTVTEGRLDRVRVRGERYFSGRQIRVALPALQPGETPDLSDLQRQVAALNARTGDRTVTPVLKAGSQPGTVDVDLDVKDTLPLHGYVQYDNRYIAGTTPNRATASLSYTNLWQRQDTVNLMYQTAPADPANAEVFSASYLAHLGEGMAAFSYIHTSSNVLALGTLGVLGQG